MSGLLDFLTGGQDEKAQSDLEKALAAIQGVQAPTAAQLNLPELQQYVNAGQMTPAQAEAALVKGNAYNDINLSPVPVTAEMSALSQLQDVAGAGGMDAEARAALTQAQNQTQTQEQGQNAYILDQLAARGIPTSLMGTAAQEANAGQQAQNLNLAGTQAAGDAEQRALQALSESAGIGGQMQGQQWNQAAQTAAAQNAIQQWNTQNQTGVNLANQQTRQQANQYNAENAQNVSNANTQTGQQRAEYNAQVPETVFNNQMQKATGQANVGNQQSQQAMQAGQQEAGLYGGLLGAGATVGGDYLQGKAMGNAMAMAPMAMGDTGGQVPGDAEVPGDSERNDKVHTLLSPGEIVVPRSIAPHPEMAKRFIEHVQRNNVPLKPIHPSDVRSVLEALTERRGEAA